MDVSRIAELHTDIDKLEALVARTEARRLAAATDPWLAGGAQISYDAFTTSRVRF